MGGGRARQIGLRAGQCRQGENHAGRPSLCPRHGVRDAAFARQRFSRQVARFLVGFDGWLTQTMSAPPAPLGHITGTAADPLRAIRHGAPTVEYPAIVANITGNPAMSVPLWWNDDGLPIVVYVLGGYGDEATLLRLAGQLETARPWTNRVPPVSAVRSMQPL